MAYYPKTRNVSGVFYYGTAGSDQILETNSTFTYDVSTNVANVTSTGITVGGITNQIEASTGNGSDYMLIASGTALRKLPLSTLSASLGGGTMNNWLVSADNGSTQTVSDTNQVDFSGAGNITITQDEVGSPYRVVISGNDQVNTYTAGSGLNEDPSNTFNVQTDNSTLEVSSDIVQVKDGGITNTKLENSSVTVQGDAGSATLSLGEILNIGGGSGIATTVAGGSPEQVTVDLTVTSVTAGSYGSSTAVGTFTVDANGRLTAASDVNIDGSSISNNTITFSANAGPDQAVTLGQTLEISGGVAANTTMSATNIATIDVKYDNQTIGLSNDQLIVKDAGVTEAKRQRTVDSSFSNGEVISSDINLVDATAGNILINLPAPPVSAGRLLYIKKIDSSSNTVTIDQNSSETIDGGTQYLLYNQYEAVTLICDGTNWHVF